MFHKQPMTVQRFGGSCGVKRIRIFVNQIFEHLHVGRTRLKIHQIYEPRSEKTGLRGFRPGPTVQS